MGLKYRRRKLRSLDEQNRIRLIASICEKLYIYSSTESLSLEPPNELRVFSSVAAPEIAVPRIFRPWPTQIEDILQKPILQAKEMEYLSELDKLEGRELYNMDI